MSSKKPNLEPGTPNPAPAKRRGRKPKSFRISAKTILLTYAKCPLELGQVLELLLHKLQRWKVLDYFLVQEKHEDGSPHIHVLISCERKVDVRSAEFLDIEGPKSESESEPKNFHGSYEGCKSEEDAFNYLCKEIFSAEDANEKMLISEGFSKKLTQHFTYLSLDKRLLSLAKSGKIGEAMEMLESEDPHRFLEQGSKIENRLKEIHLQNIGCESDYPWESYILSPELEEAVALFEQSIRLKAAKVFVLHGEPGCGKSKFLKSLLWKKLGLHVLHINNLEGLSAFNPEVHQAILLDDADLKDEDRSRIIAFLDNDKHWIKVRYRMIEIPSGIAKAIATNYTLSQMRKDYFTMEGRAYSRRTIQFSIESGVSLFNSEKTVQLAPDESKKSELKERLELEKRINEYQNRYENDAKSMASGHEKSAKKRVKKNPL